MATAKYEYQERFQNSLYWQQKLLPLWPWELDKFYASVTENNDPVFGEINFHIGVLRSYSEHGFENGYLSDEWHRLCLDKADLVADLIRTVFASHPEQVKSFDEAFELHKEFGKKFGWPTVSFEILRPTELDLIMNTKIRHVARIETQDHAHVVLSRLESIATSNNATDVTRDLFGDINQGVLCFSEGTLRGMVKQRGPQSIEAWLVSAESSKDNLELFVRTMIANYGRMHPDPLQVEYDFEPIAET